MNIQKTIAFVSVLLASTFATAMPQIKATPFQDGSWVQVTQDGMPVANAIVNDNFLTDSTGRVYIRNQRQSSIVGYSVVTPEGGMAETSAFISKNRNR